VYLLTFVTLILMGTWLRHQANDHVAAIHSANARNHYASIITELDRRWGREAFNLKTRLEAQRFLEIEQYRQDRLLAYLISQGSSIEFPLLRIENSKGELIASFDDANRSNPKATFLPGQVTSWAMDSSSGNFYAAFRQFIWLGNENGTLTLFRPMDNALLTRLAYPGTRTSLWWKEKPIASSDGEDSLTEIAAQFAKPSNGRLTIMMPWSGPEKELTPQLLVELRDEPALGFDKVWIGAGVVFLAICLASGLGLVGLWLAYSRQLRSLVQVGNSISSRDQDVTPLAVDEHLQIARSGPVDELSALANALEGQLSHLAKKADNQNWMP
jgi:HAMP domain-containing protein